MKLHALLLAFAALQALAADAAAQDAAVVTTPQVRAELVAHAPEGLQGGKAAWLGLKIEHKPHLGGDRGKPIITYAVAHQGRRHISRGHDRTAGHGCEGDKSSAKRPLVWPLR